MSLLNMYRSRVVRKRKGIAELLASQSKEQGKIAGLTTKINSASQAISRAKSSSTVRTKRNEIQQHEKSIETSRKEIAKIGKKISQKQKELNDAENKVLKEEEKELKKRNELLKKQALEQSLQISDISEAIVRHDLTLERLQSLPEKIVVLFLAANPLDQEHLRLNEEARSIMEMIRKAKHRDSVQFETRWAVRPMDVLQAINELNPTIVHFSGHGTDEDEIIFQNDDGMTKYVSLEAITQTMAATSGSIRLVVFNTCNSEKQAMAVTQHVEAAIGMNTSIGDEAARFFASQFYSALSFGLPLRTAFEQGRASIMMEGIQEENTPQLFIQQGLSADDIVIVRPKLEGK